VPDRDSVRYAKEQDLDVLVVGKGSNCLFDDRGFDGLVIVNKIMFVEELVGDLAGCFQVGGGMPFDRFGWHTARKNFSGLEFATGIPGTVGGAVYMNAGANGQVLRCLSILFSLALVRVLLRTKRAQVGYLYNKFK